MSHHRSLRALLSLGVVCAAVGAHASPQPNVDSVPPVPIAGTDDVRLAQATDEDEGASGSDDAEASDDAPWGEEEDAEWGDEPDDEEGWDDEGSGDEEGWDDDADDEEGWDDEGSGDAGWGEDEGEEGWGEDEGDEGWSDDADDGAAEEPAGGGAAPSSGGAIDWDNYRPDAFVDEPTGSSDLWEEFESGGERIEALPPTTEIVDGMGRVDGMVVDYEGGGPIADVEVTVRDRDDVVRTGGKGLFYLNLPPGVWELRFSSVGFRSVAYEVEVLEGEVLDIGPVPLPSDDAAITQFVTEGRAYRESKAQMMLERREKAAATDGVSAEEIAKSPDSSAKDAVRRVVSATIVDGRFLFVRGLGGRYTNVLLNGVAVPKTDPDYPGVQLDLFPTQLLTGVNVRKAFTPDVPGDWAGGLMELQTRSYPDEFKLQLGVSVGLSPGTTFEDALRDPSGGSLDFLGVDDGTRALPDAFPRERVNSGNAVDAARSLRNAWSTDTRMTLPDLGLKVTLGDALDLGGDRELGYLITAGYNTKSDTDDVILRRTKLETIDGVQRLVPREELDRTDYDHEVLWGSLGSVTLRLGENHQLGVVSLWNQTSNERVTRITGVTDAEDVDIRYTKWRFIERTLSFNQLLGRHTQLPGFSEIRWDLSAAWGRRDEPDTRDLRYEESSAGYAWRPVAGSGERYFTNYAQTDVGAGLDLVSPLADQWDAKYGARYLTTSRDFDARRFNYEYIGSDAATLLRPPEELFAPDAQGSITRLRESTTATDRYESGQDALAGYLMLDAAVVEPVRVVVGARVERSEQDVSALSPYAVGGAERKEAERVDTDVLPALSVVVSLPETFIWRASYGGTVARPQIRELAPLVFQDYIRGRAVIGNPDLERTFIHNLDLRGEWYPTETEVVAVSGFLKVFEKPIEQTIVQSNGSISFDNITEARNLGVEFEARMRLDRLVDGLGDYQVSTNFTLVQSSVELSDEERRLATSKERPLAGQSPYMGNLSLGYDPEGGSMSAYVYYNLLGRTLDEVGLNGLPDVYQDTQHLVDFTYSWDFAESWDLKVSAKNLLDLRRSVSQGSVRREEWYAGRSVSIGVNWSPSFGAAADEGEGSSE